MEGYGWSRSSERIEGDYSNFEDLDCGFMPIHHYFKFIKYGYARATDHVSYEIRHKRLTKKQGKELIVKYDSEFPKKYFEKFLSFLDISEEKFFKIRDKFTNLQLFENNNKLELKKKNNNELILNDVWHSSFDQ